ncbi:uncharacterized protein LOC129888519 [Solanum dulcamara]|uniref:uncharacterized protein LOC129888519 n=1 Tax=Solanum dulcamara TaxID=45834 RepID=UPI0024866A4C|nr:uncharacterized protein LOC129888519 [Solanum dulcamara]
MVNFLSYQNIITMAEISRTQIIFCSIPFYRDQIEVTVTKKASEVDRWIGQTVHIHRRRLHKLLVGLDIEWRATRNPTEETPSVALLQLCVGHRCILFQLLHADYIPNSLFAFLGNPSFSFLGVGVHDDGVKLYTDYGLFVANPVDLNKLAMVVHEIEAYGRIGLKRMAYEVLGKVMKKPFNVTMSEWDAEELVYEQVEYACIDAFVSFKLGMNLFSELFNPRKVY